ncbi:MAG: phosphoglucomutase, alpha-D-glucose phosphate-specific [Candidatus Cloacimonetes bacterium 4572_55]|nr:MAG: phosphoglucomutase, alpha-D-glucose phosphate-specific [Candidatus Cloacimonetes bacterium 4572_55]
MSLHPLAGKPAPSSLLANIPRLMTAYYVRKPDVAQKKERVAFGTSGHRGTSLKKSFNEDHILAVSQAICDYRVSRGIKGPLFMGMDTHALSEAAFTTTLEVFAANKITVMIQKGSGYTPTPVISHAILTYNRKQKGGGQADGIVVTPSHNPPEDGGFKYNSIDGGPANTTATQWIEKRANEILKARNQPVKRMWYERAFASEIIIEYDYISNYVNDLDNVVDMKAIRSSGLKIGVDPLGGSGIGYWRPIADRYGLNIEIVNKEVDPTFRFMTVDKDGKIRMDCSSPYAMANLIQLKDQYDIAYGNDPDYDRHGIVTRSAGLLNPNHYLSVAIWYLFQNRPGWSKSAAIGKTVVSSGMIDRIASHLRRELVETPVGFKWFVQGLADGSYGFGGEESAGASFLRKDGTVWTTDKDGIILDLLAAEITAKMERDPSELYRELTEKFGEPVYERIDAPATYEQKIILKNLSPDRVTATELAGEKILEKLTAAPGNSSPIGGLKVVTENGWFAARPSGTEEIYKIYTESFRGLSHLRRIQEEAQEIVNQAFLT